MDGAPAPHLDGLVDVDLEASACTNTLPVHRLVCRSARTPTSEGDFRGVLNYDAAGLVVDYPGIAARFA